MRILVVNHGYPPLFNAGSEVYTQQLVEGLLHEGCEVEVFSREENPFVPDYTLRSEGRSTQSGLKYTHHMVNVARQKDRYVSEGVDERFLEVVRRFEPDIVHFNHLNHLSLGLVQIASDQGARVVFTLHDFWLSCPRGQFLQVNYGEKRPYRLCDGQEDRKCAIRCYSRYFTGLDNETDIKYWTQWVRTRREMILSMVPLIDLFIAPSRTVLERMRGDLNIEEERVIYLDYGFDLTRLRGRKRRRGPHLVFGYIGTHIVAKGIDLLLEAFGGVEGDAELIIFGRERGETTPYLKEMAGENVTWEGEYSNEQIVEKVFDRVDVIIVPSIWLENSPLVIHEALQTRVPVITADVGGMAEYVSDGVNGLLFRHRDVDSLREKMQFLVDNPDEVERLGERGYLNSTSGDVPSLREHVGELLRYYGGVDRRQNP